MQEQKADVQQGLVISYFGNSVAVEASDGQVFPCHLRRNQELPVVGDQVVWQLDRNQSGIILNILPRRGVLVRQDKKGNPKAIAANLDFIIVVMAPPPILSEYLIDRYLVAARLLKIQAAIVLNKTDLLNEAAEAAAATNYLAAYQQIGYPIIYTSAVTQAGLNKLSDLLKGQTAVLVGPSGVGKSSIIAVLSNQSIRISEVSQKGAGKHTTTATRLYHLTHGGSLIDSPGVREFNLWRVNKHDLLLGFKEFSHYVTMCKFRDCIHTIEPGCGVQAAVSKGDISKERYASYKQLIQELENK